MRETILLCTYLLSWFISSQNEAPTCLAARNQDHYHLLYTLSVLIVSYDYDINKPYIRSELELKHSAHVHMQKQKVPISGYLQFRGSCWSETIRGIPSPTHPIPTPMAYQISTSRNCSSLGILVGRYLQLHQRDVTLRAPNFEFVT
jgi:hypothetical protein